MASIDPGFLRFIWVFQRSFHRLDFIFQVFDFISEDLVLHINPIFLILKVGIRILNISVIITKVIYDSFLPGNFH